MIFAKKYDINIFVLSKINKIHKTEVIIMKFFIGENFKFTDEYCILDGFNPVFYNQDIISIEIIKGERIKNQRKNKLFEFFIKIINRFMPKYFLKIKYRQFNTDDKILEKMIHFAPSQLAIARQLVFHISDFIAKKIREEREQSENYKKISKENIEQYHNEVSVIDSDKDKNIVTEKKDKKINNTHRKSKSTFKFVNNNSFLKYSYESVRVRGVRYRNLDLSDIHLDKEVIFVPEPENPYDSNAIKIVYRGSDSDVFIGYIPRNRLQAMVLDFLERDDRMVQGFVGEVDEEEKEIFIYMAFYEEMSDENLELLPHLDTVLVRTSKKDYMGTPRKENLKFINKDDSVEISYNFESGTYIVTDDCGQEIGEISAKETDELRKFENEGNNLYGFILDIDELDCEKNKYIIRIIAK